MRIVIIGPFPPPTTGCSHANEVLFKNLERQGIKCNRINTNTELISTSQGSSFSFKKAATFLRTYTSINKIFNCDVVYIAPGQTFFGLLKYAPFTLTAIARKKPYIIHVHGNYLGEEYKRLSGLKKRIFGYLVSHAAAGIVLSKSLMKNFTELLAHEKIFVVKNFADDTLYNNQKQEKKTDKLRILYLSNLMREKGILELLDALILLKDEMDFEAVIAGSMEKSIEKDIRQKIEVLKDKLIYTGVIHGEEKKQRLQNANVFVLPTCYKMEGQPIALLEALASGNVVITTKHAGIPDIIDDRNGFFVNKNSPESIADCLRKINAKIAHYVEVFSKPNMSYAEANFTERIFTANILSVLKKYSKK